MATFVNDERFDSLYLNVAHTTKGIDPLLDTVFSFLRRKTDFFGGPPGSGDKGTEAALEKVQEVARKHAELYRKEKTIGAKQKVTKKKPKPKPAEKNEPSVVEMGKQGEFDISPPKAQAPPSKTEEPPKASSRPKTGDNDDDDDDEKEHGPAPVGNGGTVAGKYVWTQLLSEVNVTVPLPDNTRGRDLNVTIAKKRLKVGLRQKPGEWLVDAPMTKAVIVDDSFWTVEDGNRLVINLQKLNQMEWWDSVCEGDPKINVRSINPESSKLSDLDGETRKTVEKMMYDQRQKEKGLPTSDEEQKMAMFEKFKGQHPEMDFSQAKVS